MRAADTELLAAILVEVRQIRLLLERRQHPRDESDLAVLRAIAASVPAWTHFSSAEVIRHASEVIDAHALRLALQQADCDGSPRSLGKLLRRCEGRTMDGLRLVRVAEDRGGVIWKLEVCAGLLNRSGDGRMIAS